MSPHIASKTAQRGDALGPTAMLSLALSVNEIVVEMQGVESFDSTFGSDQAKCGNDVPIVLEIDLGFGRGLAVIARLLGKSVRGV